MLCGKGNYPVRKIKQSRTIYDTDVREDICTVLSLSSQQKKIPNV